MAAATVGSGWGVPRFELGLGNWTARLAAERVAARFGLLLRAAKFGLGCWVARLAAERVAVQLGQ